MRLLAFFLLGVCLQISAKSHSQTVTLDERNISLEKVFDKIKAQTGYVFFYSYDALEEAKKITVRMKNVPVTEAIESCLKGQPIEYRIENKTVFITKGKLQLKLAESKVSFPGLMKLIPILGRILDPNGQPIDGVSVQVKNSKKGTITGADGKFTLDANKGDVLLISSIGFQNKEYVIGDETAFTVTLAFATNELDAVQIQAYGVTSKRFTTSNIGSVKSEDIEKQPVSNPLLALQGRIPGLTVVPNSGIAGDRITVRIQGINSINGGNQPFYVVDGVPFNATMIQPNNEVNSIWRQTSGKVPLGESATGGSPLNYINPSDIESIEVLKDADATAIYGSRAANGAIIITTKKGKPGPLRFDVNLRSGYTEMARQLNYMNLQEYLAMRLEAKKNNNEAILPTDYDLNGFWGNQENNNFQNYFFGKGVSYHDLQASASGGNGTTNYRINLGYIRQNSIYGSSNNDQKVSMGVNLNTASANRRFRLDFSLNGMVDQNKLPTMDLTSALLQLPPNAPAIYNPDGSLNWALGSNGFATWYNPLAALEQRNTSKTNNLTANMILSYEILKGLKFSTSLGYGRMDMDGVRINPLTGVEPAFASPGSRQAYFSSSATSNYSIEPQIYYNNRFGKLKLDWTAGSTIQKSNGNGRGFYGTGAASDDLMEDVSASSYITSSGNVSRIYRYNALFSRLTFNYGDEWLLNMTARRDGSSRFGPSSRFHNFGALGMGWIFTQREWFKTNLPILSFGKFRASYGTTGNDQIGDYTYLDLYNTYNVGVPYQDISLLSQSGGYNPELEWEQNNKLNIGLDLGLFQDRLSLTINYALNRSSNLLQTATLPNSAGISPAMLVNFPGTVENRNLEFSLSSENIRSSIFRWNTSFNITLPSNKLVSIDDLSKLIFGEQLEVGKSISGQKLYAHAGVDPLTGNLRFADRNGNPVTQADFAQDRTVFVDLTPQLYGGLSNRFSWKGLSLDVQANFIKQMTLSYLTSSSNPFTGSFVRNEPNLGISRWHAPGDVAVLSKYGYIDDFSAVMAYSDKGYENVTSIRIGTVALAWEFPEKWIRKIGMRQGTLGGQAQNLWTITNFSGLDPETGSTVLPQPRTVVFHLKFGF